MSLRLLESRFAEFDMARLSVKRQHAVYLLVESGVVVYVGRTLSLDARIAFHATYSDKVFTRALWLMVDEVDAAAMEGALIRFFKPRYCRAAPSDARRDAELLDRLGLAHDRAGSAAFLADLSAARRRRRVSRILAKQRGRLWQSVKRRLSRMVLA